jgi:hypothetical protein
MTRSGREDRTVQTGMALAKALNRPARATLAAALIHAATDADERARLAELVLAALPHAERRAVVRDQLGRLTETHPDAVTSLACSHAACSAQGGPRTAGVGVQVGVDVPARLGPENASETMEG